MPKNKFFPKVLKHQSKILWFLLITIFLLLNPSSNTYSSPVDRTYGLTLPLDIGLPKPPPIPIKISNNDIPQISAEAVLIKDIPSGIILYSKNSKEIYSPASTTKIVTALVALDYYQLDDVLTVQSDNIQGRVMGLVKKEQITFEALLNGMLIHSANDAAYALAENYPGGLAKFVEKMNDKVFDLGLTNTHLTNPAGFDDKNHFSTAEDLVKVSLYGLNNKLFSKIVSTKRIVVSDVTYSYFHDLINVNELLGKIAGVAGVKTGQTENGGEILISEVKKKDTLVIIAVLKSKERFADTEKLINYIYTNYNWLPLNNLIPTIQAK